MSNDSHAMSHGYLLPRTGKLLNMHAARQSITKTDSREFDRAEHFSIRYLQDHHTTPSTPSTL